MGGEGAEDHGVRVMFHSMSRPRTVQIYVFMFCIICFYIIYTVSAVVVSLYETAGICWFGVCWGHVTDVSRTGMFTAGFDNSTLYT